MEQMNWKKAIPVSLLTQWEINQEMQTWLEEHHKERLQQDLLYKEVVRQVTLLQAHLQKQEVRQHLEVILRILSIQFEDQRKDKDFDTGIRIIIHTNAIQDIFVSKQFKDRVTQLIFNQLTTSEEDNPTTDDLPVTEEERMDLLNKLLEDLPLSDEPIVFSLPVKPESTCWNSVLSQQEKEQLLFIAKCGRCDCHHEYPRCEECDTIRMRAGRCQSCNYNKEEEDLYSSTCGNCFQIHELPNCVECQHYRLKPGRCTNCGTIGPEDINWKDSCLEEKDYEDIMKPIMEQRDEVQQKNSKLYKFYYVCPLCRSFYHTAKACVFRKHALYFMEAKEQIQQLTTRITNSQQAGGLLFPTTTFIHSKPKDEDSDTDEEEDLTINAIRRLVRPTTPTTKEDTEVQTEETSNNSRDTDQKEEEDCIPEPPCELNRIKFENSICKVLPDTTDFPEDIFNVEGCVWCGSQGHEVLDCLGYTSWLHRFYQLDKARGITIEEWVRREKIIKTKAKSHYNPNKPWELYIGKEDGEYLTDKGVKILVKDEKIVNLIPRHLQTTTTVYADFPTPDEVHEMFRLSPITKPIARTTVMDELCNQAISFKEDMEQLEMELKTSMSLQLKKLKRDFEQEMQKFYTALMDDRIAQLPKQFDQMREYLSRTVFNLHKRSLKSDITTVRIFRELFESKTPDSNMVWKREICKADPTYQFRGRWRQMADRLNTIADYTIKANLIVPIMDDKHADDLRTVADLLIEVMYQMFCQAGILQPNDLLDMEDFSIFQEAVCRTMQLQTISANQICNFIQQIIYHNQCPRKSDYLIWTTEMRWILTLESYFKLH